MASKLNRIAKLEAKHTISSKVHGIAFNGIVDHIPTPYTEFIGKPIHSLEAAHRDIDFIIVDIVEN